MPRIFNVVLHPCQGLPRCQSLPRRRLLRHGLGNCLIHQVRDLSKERLIECVNQRKDLESCTTNEMSFCVAIMFPEKEGVCGYLAQCRSLGIPRMFYSL